MAIANATRWKTYHTARGEVIRHLKAIPVPPGTAMRLPDGVILQEQTLPPEARFLISSMTEQFESKQFGLIQTGTVTISAFPDWARFNHLDRVVLTAPGRWQSRMAQIARGATDTDTLPLPDVAAIANVYVGGVLVDAANYQLSGGGVQWLQNAPATGTVYGAEFTYCPRYIVLPQSHRNSPTDTRGASLPLHYWLDLELA